MDNKYLNGQYWQENETFHEEDSDFKFQNFLTLLNRNKLIPTNEILDIGCGAGRIIWNFANAFPNSNCTGVDLSEKIIEYAKSKYKNSNLSYLTQEDFDQRKKQYNLVILADVIEHIEDYIGFLKTIHSKYEYQLFNIPLDLSLKYLLEDRPLKMRSTVGHLHYFYDKLIMKILDDNGYRIIDHLYVNNLEIETKNAIGISKYRYMIRKYLLKFMAKILGESMASKLYGSYSLTVLSTRK